MDDDGNRDMAEFFNGSAPNLWPILGRGFRGLKLLKLLFGLRLSVDLFHVVADILLVGERDFVVVDLASGILVAADSL